MGHIEWILPTLLGLTFLGSLWAISKKPNYQTEKVSRRDLDD